MNDDTIELLKECNAGCKYATNSMEQVENYLHDAKLKSLIMEFNQKHIHLGDECHALLNEEYKDEKDPEPMSKFFAKLGTQAKLMINDDSSNIADLMVDGCNMGIKSLSKALNTFRNASPESVRLTKKLISVEKNFMDELLAYL
jgi:hypothetical protein